MGPKESLILIQKRGIGAVHVREVGMLVCRRQRELGPLQVGGGHGRDSEEIDELSDSLVVPYDDGRDAVFDGANCSVDSSSERECAGPKKTLPVRKLGEVDKQRIASGHHRRLQAGSVAKKQGKPPARRRVPSRKRNEWNFRLNNINGVLVGRRKTKDLSRCPKGSMDSDAGVGVEMVLCDDIRLVAAVDEPSWATGRDDRTDSDMGKQFAGDLSSDGNRRTMVEPDAQQPNETIRDGFRETNTIIAGDRSIWQLLPKAYDGHGNSKVVEPIDLF